MTELPATMLNVIGGNVFAKPLPCSPRYDELKTEHCSTDASLLYGDKLVLQIEGKRNCEAKKGHIPLTAEATDTQHE
jgi:hypothetical protein